jgi:rhamnosyltransferase subunit B
VVRVLVVVHGTDGDVLPFLTVGQALRARGHQVTVFTHAYHRPAVAAAGLELVEVDTVAAYERYLRDAADQVGATELAQFRDHYLRTGLLAQFRFECAQLLRRHEPGATVLVGATISSQSVLTAAEATGAPVVCLAHAPYHLAARAGVGWVYQQCLAAEVDAVRAGFGLPPVPDWPGWTDRATHVGLWPEWFDRAGDPAPAGAALAGFVPPPAGPAQPAPAAAEALLAGEPGPVLITGGTSRMLPPDHYRIVLEGAVAVGRPVLVVVRHRDLVPAVLPAGAHWFPHLPFRTVLPRVAALVHHGGIGTVAQALAAGTPQVLLADGLDRPDNARRLHRLGLGEALLGPDRTAEHLAERLALVLNRGRASARSFDPIAADRVAAAVEASLPARGPLPVTR